MSLTGGNPATPLFTEPMLPVTVDTPELVIPETARPAKPAAVNRSI